MSDDTDLAPELDAGERAALTAWPAPTPSDGFADRVLGAPARPALAGRPRPGGRRLVAAVVIAALAAAAVIAIAVTRRDDGAPTAGASTVAARSSIAIGGRATAVAEPGTVLAWSVSAGGDARIEQGAGNVFYRVDHGGPFVVVTPLGEVRVTGTCFRIEVIMKASRQTVVSGVVGAALAAAVVVTVYEGGVVVAGGHGSAAVAPGERATLTPGGSPTVASGDAVAELAPPGAAATREQLLARDELQRQRIAGLSSRVSQLERELASGGGAGGGAPAGKLPRDDDNWMDPTPDELAAYAKNCEVRLDMPPILSSQPFELGAEDADDYGLTEGERGPVTEVMLAQQRALADKIRAIYVDVTGEAEPGMSAQAMIQEIQDKGQPGEREAIVTRIAQERAGLAQPPADWSQASPVERLFRTLAALGDESEHALAARLGPDRARELRLKEGGWPDKWSMSGCKERPNR